MQVLTIWLSFFHRYLSCLSLFPPPLCIEHNIHIYSPFVENLTQLWGGEWNCPHIHHHSSLIIATWKTLDASWWLRWGWRALRRWCRRWCPRLSEGFRWAASEQGPASRISLRCQCQCSDFRCIQQLLICNRSNWLLIRLVVESTLKYQTECDISSRDFSVSRLFLFFWESCSRSRKVSVSVSKILFSKKSHSWSWKFWSQKKSQTRSKKKSQYRSRWKIWSRHSMMEWNWEKEFTFN